MDEESRDGIEKTGYEKNYSEEGFWSTVKRVAALAGKEVIGHSLVLFYAAQSDKTPLWAKTVIFGALGYFINAIDAIPDLTPVVGFADDLGVLVAAIATVAAFISPSSREQAEAKLQKWFGPVDETENDENKTPEE